MAIWNNPAVNIQAKQKLAKNKLLLHALLNSSVYLKSTKRK